jgi:hypothetical protein
MNQPEQTVQDICNLYNADPRVEAVIELPSEDLHALALDWSRMNNLLIELREKFLASSATASLLAQQVTKAFEARDTVRDVCGITITRADFDADAKADKIEKNCR